MSDVHLIICVNCCPGVTHAPDYMFADWCMRCCPSLLPCSDLLILIHHGVCWRKKRRDGLHSFSFSTSVASGLVYFMRETVVKICTRLGSTAVPVYTFRLLHIFPSSNSDTVSTKHLISLGMPHVTYSWTYMEVQAHFFFFFQVVLNTI